MQGEVFVEYTPIGGSNINSRITTYDISGSTFPPGSSTGMINVKWTYPGGITDTTYSGEGLWGYLFQSHTEGGVLVYDHDLEAYLDEKQLTETEAIRTEINNLVRSYVTRVLMYHPGADEYETYGWIAFQNTFVSCYSE